MTAAEPRGCQRGFTVLEALIAATIFMAVLLGAFTVYGTNSSVFNKGQSRAAVQQNARSALEAAAREIRMAGYDHSAVFASLSPVAAIRAGTASSITFVADVTGEGVLDQVSYQLSGPQLTRSVASWTGSAFGAASTGAVADGVTQLAFTYFNPSDAVLTAPLSSGDLPNVRRVTISVVTAETTVGEQQSFPLVLDVRLRNR